MRRAILLLVFPVFCAVAQDMPQLRDGESRDHQYDAKLLVAPGRLRLCVVAREGNKLLVEIPSAFEPLLKDNDNAADYARRTRAYWGPDSGYLVLREPDNSGTQSAIILVSVGKDGAKQVPIDMDKMKKLSPRKHTDWSVEFGDWIGKRTFVVRLYGMTFKSDGPNEHDETAIICHITKDGDVAMTSADE